MAAKKETGKFTAFVKYTVEIEVPINALTLEGAAAYAANLKTADLYKKTYTVVEFHEPKVTAVLVA